MSNYENLLPSSKTFSCSWWGMIKKTKLELAKSKTRLDLNRFVISCNSGGRLIISKSVVGYEGLLLWKEQEVALFSFAHVGHICWRAVCRTSCSGSFFPSLVASSSLRVSEGESSGARRSSHIRWCSLTVQSEYSNTNVNFAAVYLEL